MMLPEAVRLVRSIQEEMLRAGVLRIAKVVTTPERFEALEMVLSACVPCAELTEACAGYGEFDSPSGAERCDEPAKPEAGPMRNAESPSGVQALGSSGLAQRDIPTILRTIREDQYPSEEQICAIDAVLRAIDALGYDRDNWHSQAHLLATELEMERGRSIPLRAALATFRARKPEPTLTSYSAHAVNRLIEAIEEVLGP